MAMTPEELADIERRAKVAGNIRPQRALALVAEVRRLQAALDEAQLRSIEARNPGIDMEQVKAERARNSTCPHGRHFGGHYCEDCESAGGSMSSSGEGTNDDQ